MSDPDDAIKAEDITSERVVRLVGYMESALSDEQSMHRIATDGLKKRNAKEFLKKNAQEYRKMNNVSEDDFQYHTYSGTKKFIKSKETVINNFLQQAGDSKVWINGFGSINSEIKNPPNWMKKK